MTTKINLPQLQTQYHIRYQTQPQTPYQFIQTLFVAILLLFSFGLFAAQTDNTGSTPIPLHNLSNDKLLKQTSDIYHQASEQYLAQLRGLAKSQFLLDKSQKQLADMNSVKASVKVPKGTPPLKAAKMTAEQAKKRMEGLQQQLTLLQTTKTQQQQYLELITPTLSAANRFMTALNDLDVFLFEIRLRVKDGTLKANLVPGELRQGAVNNVQKKLSQRQEGLAWQARSATKQSKQIHRDVQKNHKAFVTAQSLYTSAEKTYTQELNGQSLEKAYRQKSAEALLLDLAELNEELVWLNGAFNLSIGRFNSNKSKVTQIQQDIAELQPPKDTRLLQQAVIHAPEVEQATQQVEQLVAYHTKRLTHLQTLNDTLQTLVKQSDTFQADGTLLDAHIFKMQVIARVLRDFARKGKITLKQIPKSNRLDALTKTSQNTIKQTTEVLSTTRLATEQLVQVSANIEKSENTRSDIQARLPLLQKTAQTARKAEQINAQLKDLTAQQIIERFNQNSTAMTSNKQQVQKAKEAWQTSLTEAEQNLKQFESFNDPLLTTNQANAITEKQNIAQKLHELAEIEFVTDQKQRFKENSTQTPAATDVKAESTESSNKRYQNLITNRIRITEQQEKAKQVSLTALNTAQQQLESYITVLNEANNLALQHYANTSELKKRVGRQELSSSDIPQDIALGLKRDDIATLEQAIGDLGNWQIQLSQQIKTLEEKDQISAEIQTLSTNVLTLVNNRLDNLQDWQKLQQDFKAEQAAMSGAERKSLEQAALRRLKSEDSFKEYLASFVPSQSADNLSTLLRDYFLELTNIEKQQKNLNLQIAEAESLVKLAEEEKVMVEKLLPFFDQQATQLKNRQQIQWAKVSMQLAPDKAEEILTQFEEKTGNRFSIPPAIAEQDKAAAIKNQTEQLYHHYNQGVAIGHWIDLFEKRLSSGPAALAAEMANYQQEIGQLHTLNASLQRRAGILQGHPQSQLPAASPDGQPITAEQKNLFLEGEIGLLRTERLKNSTQTGIVVVSQLAVIVLITFLLLKLANRFATRTIALEEAKDTISAQNILVYTLLHGAAKTLIWVLAIIIGLHFVGFNVGAILAGLGIFGFAIAMASREMIANLIGGINLLVAKPFKVSDFVLFDNRWCGVEKIGLQYTKLREFKTNFLIIVPNSKLSEAPLINTNADHRHYRKNLKLPLSRRTSAAQIELALKLLNELVDASDIVEMKQMFVNNFDEYAIVINLRYDVLDIGNLPNAFDEIQIKIVDAFATNGIEFAAKPYFNQDPLEAVEPDGGMLQG